MPTFLVGIFYDLNLANPGIFDSQKHLKPIYLSYFCNDEKRGLHYRRLWSCGHCIL